MEKSEGKIEKPTEEKVIIEGCSTCIFILRMAIFVISMLAVYALLKMLEKTE